MISNFPGTDEKEKLNTVFVLAPPWLVWFTFGDYTPNCWASHYQIFLASQVSRALGNKFPTLVGVAE